MSELHCPATLLVARHGEADYGAAPDELTDLGGWLTPHGREQATALGRSLAGRHVAAVYTSRLERAIETGTLAGESLGLTSSAVDGLQEFVMGELAGARVDDPRLMQTYRAWVVDGELDVRMPGAETGHEILARYRDGLLGIADQHRGETVLVISHGAAMSFALPRLAGNVPDDLMPAPSLANCSVVELAVGDRGIEVVRWPDERATVLFGAAVEQNG